MNALFSPAASTRALDADLVQRADEAEAVDDDADRADEARAVDVDAVGRGGDVVAARRRDLLDHRVHGNVGMLGAQAAHLVVDLPGLHGTAAGAVDPQQRRPSCRGCGTPPAARRSRARRSRGWSRSSRRARRPAPCTCRGRSGAPRRRARGSMSPTSSAIAGETTLKKIPQRRARRRSTRRSCARAASAVVPSLRPPCRPSSFACAFERASLLRRDRPTRRRRARRPP